MTEADARGHAVLEAVVESAVERVRWEAAELLSRRDRPYAADLLRARSSELQTSGAAGDQVASAALEQAADDVERGRPPLPGGAAFYFGQPAGRDRRLEVRREVYAGFRVMEGEADDLVARLEGEIRTASHGPGAAAMLPGALLELARLYRILWDDPRIPASCSVRLLMLCSVARLVDRARALHALRRPAARRRAGRSGAAAPGTRAEETAPGVR